MAVSQGVKKREERSRKIIASLATNEAAIAEAVVSELSPYLKEGEGLTTDGFEVMLRCLRRRAQTHTSEMRRADEEHNRELGEDTAARVNLDRDKDKAYEYLRDFKDAAFRAHGKDLLKEMQVGGPTPRDPLSVTRQLGLVVAWLQDETKELPPAVSPFVTPIQRRRSSALLQPVLEALEASSTTLARELRESEGTMLAKHKALDRYDRTESETTSVASHLMLIASMDDEADRLRPTTASRAASSPAEELPAEGAPDDAPSDAPPTDESTPADGA